MKTRTIILIAMAIFFAAPLQAAEGIGNLTGIIDTTFAMDDSFDGISSSNTMVGGGLRLEFDLPYDLSLGLDYTYSSAEGGLFGGIYDTLYELHSPKISLRWKYDVTDWFEPYVLGLFAFDFQHAKVDSGGYALVDKYQNWLPGFGGFGGVRFKLPQSTLQTWDTWRGFNFGLFVEAGYMYHMGIDLDYSAQPYVQLDEAGASGTSLGTLRSGGPSVRTGLFWSF